MKYVRQQDLIASVDTEAEIFSLPIPQPLTRYFIAAGIRIGFLSLCLCGLIAMSL